MNPQDEFIHPAKAERGWSESYYFYFADHAQKIFLFTRMGLRPGDGWGDGLHSKHTWALAPGPVCNCAMAAKQSPTPAQPIKSQTPKAEPNSPSDLPAAKTSMRRYPRR